MFRPKVKIDPDLYHKLQQAGETKGYASTEEYITHILENTVKDDSGDESEEEVKKRLQGLGYLE